MDISYKKYYLICLLLVGANLLKAESPHPAWRNYTPDHGLPSSEIHCILQDSEGYMWFGTDNGISRFDGYTFRNFGAREGLLDNVVFELLEDHQGRVWMNTMNGNLYYFEQDSIHAYLYNDTIQQFRSRFFVAKRFFVDEEQTVYTCLMDLGILKIGKNGDHELFQSTSKEAKLIKNVDDHFLYSISNRRSNNASSDFLKSADPLSLGGPVEFLTDTGSIQTSQIKRLNTNRAARPEIFSFGNNQYLLYGNGLIHFINAYDLSWQQTAPGFITHLLNTAGSHFFLCLNYGGGIRRYPTIDHLRTNEFEQYLEGYSVTKAYQDQMGGLWIATRENGVFYAPNEIFKVYDANTGLSNSFVTTVEPDGDGGIFVGLQNNEVYHLSSSGEQRLVYQDDTAPKKPIYDLWYDQEASTLWIGGTGKLIYIHRDETAVLTFMDPGNNREESITLKDISPVKGSGKLWGASPLGITHIDARAKKFLLVTDQAFGSIEYKERVFTVYEDKSGRVLLGKENGLYDWKNGAPQPALIKHPALQVRIEDIAQLSDSTLVIATKGQGLALWKDTVIQQFTVDQGLTADMLENVEVDEQDQIWVGTLNGLNKISRKDGETWSIEKLTTDHGLPSNEINDISIAGADVWVATTHGLVHFKDNQWERRTPKMPLLSALFINEEQVSNAVTVFDHDENNVIVHFITLNYRQDGRVSYRHRLLPVQQNWTHTQNTSVNYSALNDGRYTFEVQSQNEDGIWSDSTRLDLEIRPPFWETWWFILLVAGMMGWAAYRYYMYRTHQIRQEAEMVKQVAELERSALRAQMNPHFIFNCLNSISNFISKGDKVAANEYLSTFAQLIRSVLNHSRAEKISLEDELRLLENYMQLEQMRFEGRFDYHIDLDPGIYPFDIEIPPMMIQPYVENAIIHGLGKKKEKGIIRLNCALRNGQLVFTIQDNGMGIEQSRQAKAGDPALQKSVGMTITARRLEMLSDGNNKGRVELEELKNTEGKPSGTKVIIRIPI